MSLISRPTPVSGDLNVSLLSAMLSDSGKVLTFAVSWANPPIFALAATVSSGLVFIREFQMVSCLGMWVVCTGDV